MPTDQMKDRQLYGFDLLRRAGQPGFTAHRGDEGLR
jgi:hypothetical protein